MDLGKIGITYEGAYDSERLYEPLSIVAHSNGGVYMSIAEVAEVDPASDATKWAVMVPPGTMTTSMISQEDVDDTKKVPSSSLFNSVISNLKNLIAEKIAKTSITNTNVNDANKVPSAALLYSLNSNLVNINHNDSLLFRKTINKWCDESEIGIAGIYKIESINNDLWNRINNSSKLTNVGDYTLVLIGTNTTDSGYIYCSQGFLTSPRWGSGFGVIQVWEGNFKLWGVIAV